MATPGDNNGNGNGPSMTPDELVSAVTNSLSSAISNGMTQVVSLLGNDPTARQITETAVGVTNRIANAVAPPPRLPVLETAQVNAQPGGKGPGSKSNSLA